MPITGVGQEQLIKKRKTLPKAKLSYVHSSVCEGVCQIGEVYARSWVVVLRLIPKGQTGS